jgi:triacylglycerol lipase
MRAVPYDPSRRALYHPEIGPTVFAPGAAVAPALFAAECARLAYKKFDRDAAARDEVVAALACTGYGDVAFFSVEGTDAYAATQAATGSVVVAFRGTEQDPRDLQTDAHFVKVAWQRGGMVHGGFATAIEHVSPALAAWLSTHPGPALFTGHSLGGALACLAASRATPARLATFGCPRVGDAAFVATLAGVAVERYVNCCDVVCRVPPVAFGFVHPSSPAYIDADGLVHADLAAIDVRADRRRARREYLRAHARDLATNLVFRDLADHSPINYVFPLAAPPSS